MNGYSWRDYKGASHGEECREKFFETNCKICGADVWYFQCSHGCKVFFHKVPWIHSVWDCSCPANNNKIDNFSSNVNNEVQNKFNYNFNEEEESFNYNFNEEEESFNYNFNED